MVHPLFRSGRSIHPISMSGQRAKNVRRLSQPMSVSILPVDAGCFVRIYALANKTPEPPGPYACFRGGYMRKSTKISAAIGVFVSLVFFIAFVPEGLAQSTFTGVVKDQSG